MSTWQSWGVSVTGPGHTRAGMPNQDAWASWTNSWGDVLVVSDGLGSCLHAEKGSQLACEAVRQAAEICARNKLWESPEFPHLIQILWRMLAYPLRPEECSATCLFVIRENGGDVIFGTLGDGLLAGLREDGTVEVLSLDKEGSFSNFTASLSSACGSEWTLRRDTASKYLGFLLCTDGVADDLIPDSVADFVATTLAHYAESSEDDVTEQVGGWLNSWPVPGHTDDKTVACLFQSRGGHE